MVSQLKPLSLSSGPTIVRHPLLQTVEGTVQVFTALHRNFFTNVMVQALRIADQGKAVLIVQFLKGGIHQGPDHPMQLGQNLDWIRCDMPRCIHDALVSADEKQAIQDLWLHTQSLVAKGRYGLVVLDELSLAVNYGLIPTEEVVEFIQQRPPQVDVILTGPDMPESLTAVADQVTEFRRNLLP
ncbi:P-loop NTPase family protein [Nodosilinea sp. LEGE 07088]|uniref:P-loop NTPase family protein n=1 Tax=Nodosilinea sp. LEGE 07088 TaxID=2777968 RepID=UPI00188134B0|nr:P-loop NTPase family protein [Nodosilinea sp. LEGE 07088]MBE9136269.1 P-loop NTPase family protein [Nodosilinea sp. LEGE 07088]